MRDLVERDKAIKAVDDLPNCYNGYSDAYDKAYIIGVLEEVPSAQPELPIKQKCTICPHCDNCDVNDDGTMSQPEIIRCKDCKHWNTTWQNDWAKNYHYCLMTDGTHRGDWYCADAERRTDG